MGRRRKSWFAIVKEDLKKRGKAKSTYLKQKRSNRKEENAMLPEEAGGTTEEEKDKNREANIVRSGLFPQNNILVHENRTDFSEQDLFVPWKIKNEKFHRKTSPDSPVPVFHRYYHVFKEGEIEEIVGRFSSVEINDSYYDEGNWCISFKKKLTQIRL